MDCSTSEDVRMLNLLTRVLPYILQYTLTKIYASLPVWTMGKSLFQQYISALIITSFTVTLLYDLLHN